MIDSNKKSRKKHPVARWSITQFKYRKRFLSVTSDSDEKKSMNIEVCGSMCPRFLFFPSSTTEIRAAASQMTAKGRRRSFSARKSSDSEAERPRFSGRDAGSGAAWDWLALARKRGEWKPRK
jgi:hypothetical protein